LRIDPYYAEAHNLDMSEQELAGIKHRVAKIETVEWAAQSDVGSIPSKLVSDEEI